MVMLTFITHIFQHSSDVHQVPLNTPTGNAAPEQQRSDVAISGIFRDHSASASTSTSPVARTVTAKHATAALGTVATTRATTITSGSSSSSTSTAANVAAAVAIPNISVRASAEAVDSRTHPASTKNNIMSNAVHNEYSCPASIEKMYRTAAESATFELDLAFCRNAIGKRGVVVGKSWGQLNKVEQKRWDTVQCNEIMNAGKLLSCNERWGWAMLENWLSKPYNLVTGVSNVTCSENEKASQFCAMNNIIVDFSKLGQSGKTRRFQEGFITTVGQLKDPRRFPPLVGHQHRSLEPDQTHPAMKSNNIRKLESKCDVIETRPVFVNTNDDIFNLGHYSNDVVGVWGSVMLSGRSAENAVLINIDGIRPGGPAGVGSYRIMVQNQPDTHGPYNGYFESWFGEVKKGVDYGSSKVCFSEIYWPIFPGVAWFWNDWSRINECSMQAASPLYQSFNLYLRARWLKKYGPASLTPPPTDKVHVVIEVRSINPAKKNAHSSARHIKNLQQLISALESIPDVVVTAKDFATLPFPEQVRLSHSASIFMSMHGAGTTHIFHSAVGSPNCCALIELFPDRTVNLYTAQGYGNLARMFGMHHQRKSIISTTDSSK